MKQHLPLIAALLVLGCQPEPIDSITAPTVHGAILGQSNAVGLGLDPNRPPMPDVLWRQHAGKVDTDWGPLSTRPDGGFGAEFGIARAAQADGYDVTLEKFAVGSTALSPTWLDELGPEAIQYLAGENLNFVLWWQGESDALSQTSATSYGDNLIELVSRLRTELDLPELIVVAVQIRPKMVAYPFTVEERTSLETWRASDPILNRVIDVDDLPVDPANHVHYMNDGLDEAGRRAWEAFR